MIPEADGIRIALVERDPHEWGRIPIDCIPLGEECRLSIPGRRADESERPLTPASQPTNEIRPVDQTVTNGRRPQLRAHDSVFTAHSAAF
jgi:hypothetical protein